MELRDTHPGVCTKSPKLLKTKGGSREKSGRENKSAQAYENRGFVTEGD